MARFAGGLRLVAIAMVLTGASVAREVAATMHVDRVEISGTGLTTLPMQVHGRALRAAADGGYLRQWPGTYFETGFRGSTALFQVGQGDVILHVLVDGQPVQTLTKPATGFYRIGGLSGGPHRLRIEVATESQDGATTFGGFFAERPTKAAPLVPRSRQIEFIGDSHTVGYGNLSGKRDCTQAEIWATTDTSRGFAAKLARRYGADYEVNAISGHGIVRNYNGFAADTLPEAYPYTVFDKRERAATTGWWPQVIVIGLGTNDFTTPLHAGERWQTRDALHRDYEATYTRFVRDLRARHPDARIILWATDLANGEIEAEARKVVTQLRSLGDNGVRFVPVHTLTFTACNAHPSLADQEVIADKIGAAIAASVGWTHPQTSRTP